MTEPTLDEQIAAQRFNVSACEGSQSAKDMEGAILASLERLKAIDEARKGG